MSCRTNLRNHTSQYETYEALLEAHITYPSLPRSQMKFFNCSSLKPCPIQLKLGLRLYTSFFPGCTFLISLENPAAFCTLGSAVSSQSRSAYGANSMARLVAAARPAR